MKITINPHSPTPLYAQIVAVIKDQIISRQILKNQALPSIRNMAKDLEVNSLTIQKAYKLLESERLIEIKKGVGAFVCLDVNELSTEQKYSQLFEKADSIVLKAKQFGLSKSDLNKVINKSWESIND